MDPRCKLKLEADFRRSEIHEVIDRFIFEYAHADIRTIQFGASSLSYSVVDEMRETEMPGAAEAACNESGEP